MLPKPGQQALRRKLVEATVLVISAVTLVETAIVLSARMQKDARGSLARFIEENQVIVTPFTEAHYGIAVTAWLKYGKGRHPAALNFGDCLSYATAKAAEMLLLCVGEDFPQTEILLA